jgi:hypothetical protein
LSKPLCIYHSNCADGFAAAWVVRRYFGGEVDFHPGVYNDPPPDVSGRHVILVDFSYKREVLLGMAKTAQGLLVLDHHKSAAEDLAGDREKITDMPSAYTGRLSWNRFLTDCYQDYCEGIPGRIYTLFDMHRSGAGISWDFFYPHEPRPRIIDHIEDRDLWRFAIPGTRFIQASIFSHPYDFGVWDALMKADLSVLQAEGDAIERKHHKDIAELVKVCRRELRIGGLWVPAASLPYTLTSDAGHLMCQPYASPNLQGEIVTPPFAACYWDTPAGRVFSLRSIEGGADVSGIAKIYGGGGHRNAAGFRVSFEEAANFEARP